MTGSRKLTLTEHLLPLSTPVPYSAATQHPFLTATQDGRSNAGLLGLFLSQDVLYAGLAYPRFIGQLIAKLPLNYHYAYGTPERKKQDNITKILSASLANVLREVDFFEHTCQKYNIEISGWRERKATRDYMAEMAKVASWGTLEEGLIFLWAMEKVYLDAWSSVADGLRPLQAQDVVAQAATDLAVNWSTDEFKDFVKELAAIVDQLDIEPDSVAWKRAEEIWARVVELEEQFWPTEGEEVTMRLKAA